MTNMVAKNMVQMLATVRDNAATLQAEDTGSLVPGSVLVDMIHQATDAQLGRPVPPLASLSFSHYW